MLLYSTGCVKKVNAFKFKLATNYCILTARINGCNLVRLIRQFDFIEISGCKLLILKTFKRLVNLAVNHLGGCFELFCYTAFTRLLVCFMLQNFNVLFGKFSFCFIVQFNLWAVVFTRSFHTSFRFDWVSWLPFSTRYFGDFPISPRANGAKRRSGRKPGARVTITPGLLLHTAIYTRGKRQHSGFKSGCHRRVGVIVGWVVISLISKIWMFISGRGKNDKKNM